MKNVPQGHPVEFKDGWPSVPHDPIVPFVEGDGTGPDIGRAAVRVLDAAVNRAGEGERRIIWREVPSGEKAFNQPKSWMPDETGAAFRGCLVGIKGQGLLTTSVVSIRSLDDALRPLPELYLCLRSADRCHEYGRAG